MTLTPDQHRAALETLSSSVCVNANAGSGKTTILIERIMAFLKQDENNIGRILAITFTDKAAQQMREKLADEMRKQNQPYWLVETAYISTIHAFCARILRENCFEAGLDPAFRVLGDAEAALLQEDAAKAAIEAQLSGDEPGILELLERYSAEKLIESIASSLDQLRAGGLLQADLEKFIRISPTASAEILQKNIEEKRQEIYQQCQRIIYPLQNCSFEKEKLEKFRQELLNTASLNELIRLLPEIKFQGAGKKETYAPLSEARDKLKEVTEIIEELDSAIPEELGLMLSAIFLKLIFVAGQKYEELKKKTSALDYEDLQLKTLELFQNNTPLRQAYQNLFVQVFVDEFQDTNPLQTKLIELIRQKDNLFLVGDWKQSIYLFRYADVSIFQKYLERCTAGEGEAIQLKENFRSEKGILEFVNRLCRPVIGKKYAPLIFPENKTAESANTSVTFVECPGSRTQPIEISRQAEAKLVVDKIKELIATGHKPGEITLLFRTYAPFEVYEDLFEAAGIKFVAFGGRNYFKRQEISTVLNYLKTLSDPADELALSMVLRSSLGGIGDETLFLLCQGRQKLKIKLRAYIEDKRYAELALPPAEIARLNLFQENLVTLRSYSGRLSIPELLSQMFAKTGYQDIVLAGNSPTRALANLLKLQEIAKNFANRTDVTLANFVRYIDSLQLREVREEDAATVETDADAVKLLTIHKAKGMEFPILFLPDLYSVKSRKAERILLDPELLQQGFPIGFRYHDENKTEKDPGYTLQTSAFVLLGAKQETALQAESGRLWYVALTRARQEIHLSALVPEKKEEKTIAEDIYQSSPNWSLWLQRLQEDGALKPEEINWVEWNEQNIPRVWRRPNQTSWRLPKDIRPEIFAQKQETKTFQHLTAGQAALLATAPHDYFRQEYLGFSELNLAESRQMGTFVHNLIEKGETSFEPEINKSRLSEKAKALARKCLTNYFNSDICKKISGGAEHHFELAFESKNQETYLSGRIDLVYQENKTWHIVDFKTNTKTSENLQEYKTQIKIYAEALAAQQQIKTNQIKTEIYYLLENEIL